MRRHRVLSPIPRQTYNTIRADSIFLLSRYRSKQQVLVRKKEWQVCIPATENDSLHWQNNTQSVREEQA